MLQKKDKGSGRVCEAWVLMSVTSHSIEEVYEKADLQKCG